MRQIITTKDFRWAVDSYSHNFFRCLELLIGRKDGIRLEMSARGRVVNGVVVFLEHTPHTLESRIALWEVRIRELLKSIRHRRFHIYIPLIQTNSGLKIPASPFLFAVAFDTAGTSTRGSTSPQNKTFTPGSVTNNLITTTANGSVSNGSPAMTYNSVSMTQIGVASQNVGSSFQYSWYIAGTASGAQTAALTFTSGTWDFEINNYTGVRQTTPVPDTATVNSSGSPKNWTPSLTTTVDNSWVGLGFTNSSGAVTFTTNVTQRATATGNTLYGDTNAVVSPAGSLQMTLTTGSASSDWGGQMFSIAPVVAAASAGGIGAPMLSLLGVGL